MNHSLHATGVSNLFHAGVPDKIIWRDQVICLWMDCGNINVLLLSKQKVFQKSLFLTVRMYLFSNLNLITFFTKTKLLSSYSKYFWMCCAVEIVLFYISIHKLAMLQAIKIHINMISNSC